MPEDTKVETAVVDEVSDLKKKMADGDAKAADEQKKDEQKKEDQPEKKVKEDKCKKVKPPPPPPVYKKDFEKDVVYLYQFSRFPNIPSLSPYCFKVETYLKYKNIKYECVNHNLKCRSKRGLLPFIELNGEEIPDSDIIIDTLSKKMDKDMDEGMDKEQSVLQYALIKMLENHFHWCLMHWYSRDVNNTIRSYNVNLQNLMGTRIPNNVLLFMIQHTYFKKNLKRVKAAGFGCYTNDEIDEMGRKDLKMLSDALGKRDFFFGAEPRSLDIRAFVWLAMVINIDEAVPCVLRNYVNEECQNLVEFYKRMKALTWGDDWDAATGDRMELNPHIAPPEEEKKEDKAEEKKEKEEEKKKVKEEVVEEKKEKE